MPAVPVTRNSIRAEELVLPLPTFEQGDFAIFLPNVVRFAPDSDCLLSK